MKWKRPERAVGNDVETLRTGQQFFDRSEQKLVQLSRWIAVSEVAARDDVRKFADRRRELLFPFRNDVHRQVRGAFPARLQCEQDRPLGRDRIRERDRTGGQRDQRPVEIELRVVSAQRPLSGEAQLKFMKIETGLGELAIETRERVFVGRAENSAIEVLD